MAKKASEIEGAIVEIPRPNSSPFLAKVTFVSRLHKNVIALQQWTRNEGTSGNPVYTSARAIGRMWAVVDREPVSSAEKAATARIVGGSVMIEDEVQRPATPGDMKTLPQMDVLGTGVVEMWAQGEYTA